MAMKQQHIVIVEDEADIAEVIEYSLSREGFETSSALNGQDGLELAQSVKPDLVLLDLMLPGLDGIEICRELKSDANTRSIPIIMVTAKGDESDIVLGLSMGADDYVTKPFSPKELVARVKAVLRRSSAKPESADQDRIVLDGVTIDVTRHEVLVDGQSVAFTATDLRLLHFLARHPGRVFTRNHLLSRVIGEDVIVIDRNIDVHVRAVRKKLGDHADMIETIRGVGYRFRDRESD
jgi:two-component system alkaline phosphatase synthesis response regulator PhoP